MNYALIGCGRISPNHIDAATKNNINIVALCDVNQSSIEEVIKRHKLNSEIKKYTDYKELIKNEKLDFVAIATDSGKHAEIALYCIENGVHVIIEKPIAMSIEDCDKIIELSEAKNIKVCACHQNRFNKSVQKMRSALDSGAFGKLSHASISVRWNRTENYYKQASWRGTWEQDGGALMNQCIHGIDLLRWSLGDDIDEVYGVTTKVMHDYIECEDLGTAIVKFKNGTTGIIEGTTNVYPKDLEETLYIFGETGTVKLGGTCANTIDVWDFKNNIEDANGLIEETKNVYGNGHSTVYEDFISAIKNNRKPYIDARAGKRAVELVIAIYKSSYEKKPVKLPLEKAIVSDFSKTFQK